MLYYVVCHDRQRSAKLFSVIHKNTSLRDILQLKESVFGACLVKSLNRKVQSAWSPELANFEPSNCECQDITII